jgi:glycerophosphoryl diester phosphodiesterase
LDILFKIMRYLYIFQLSIVFTLFSCKKNEVNLKNNPVIILGHGGMGIGYTYPMNSYESIAYCLNLGADGSEIDVQMTKDGILVAFHDDELSDGTTLKGSINSLDWSEIKNEKYKQNPYQNYSIVSLDDIFSNINNIGNYKFSLDCKLYSYKTDPTLFFEKYSEALINIIEKYNIEDNTYIESTDISFLNLLKNKKPNYKLLIYPPSFNSGIEMAMNNGLSGISISTKNITENEVNIAHSKNLIVALWNIQTHAENTDALAKKPDIIQTDKLKKLIKLLDK